MATAGEVSLVLPSVAVHRVVRDEAVVVLMAVSGETPECAALARNIGQSENVVAGCGRVPRPAGLRPGAADSFAACAAPGREAAPAVPATARPPPGRRLPPR